MTMRAGISILGRLGRINVATASLLAIAGCGSDDGGGGSRKPPEPVVDVVSDTNRNGLLELDPGLDDIGEEKWTPAAGAVFMVNLDDDDGDHKADNTDEIVNGPADELDLARFAVAGWEEAPDTESATVTFDPESKAHVRVFRRTANGWVKIDTGVPLNLTAAELRTHTEFAIEGLDFIRKVDQPWQGLFRVTLTVNDTKKGLVGTNTTEMRQSPWLANHNLRHFDRAYYSPFSQRLTETFPEPLSEFGLEILNFPDDQDEPNGWTDIWYEDWMQTGYTEMPSANGEVHGMVIFNPRPWGRDGNVPIDFLRAQMLGPDVGVAVFFDEATEKQKGTTYDSHGNHDALPPYPAFPAGRVFTGSNVLKSTQDFYAAQQVQPPLVLKTDWLTVGHIDETYAPVRAATPNGFKLLQNTPSLGKQIFEDWEAQGHGSAVVFEGLMDFQFHQWQTTVAEINSDPELMAWNQEAQTHIDEMHDQLLAEGFTEDDIVPVPVLYEEIDGGKIAYLPDTANVRVVNGGDTTIFPKPHGPIIDGADGFQKWFEAYLKDPKHKLGKDGNGPIIRYGDSWDYHVLLGDIHCASNWSSLPSKDEPRWWVGAK